VGLPTVTSRPLSGKLCHPLAQTSSYATGQKLLYCHARAELFCNISLHGKRTLSNRDRFVLQFRPKFIYCLHLAYRCDRISRAAYAQSFALWQEATIEFTCHDHSPRMLVVTFNRSHRQYHQRLHAMITLLLLVRATYMYGVVLHAELRTTFTSWSQHHFVDVSLTL